MKDLKLQISDKAREKLEKDGKEGFVIIRRLGSGWGARTAALVESGRPPAESGFVKLQDGEITIWVPEELSFPDNVVRIEHRGFLWNTYLEAVTDVLPRGGCAVWKSRSRSTKI